MDRLVEAFTRVQRGISVQQDILKAISDLDNGSLTPADVSVELKVGVLDLPDVDDLDASVQTKSSLSRTDLVNRAVDSPSDLTTDEISLLKKRYWTDQTDAEAARQSSALSGLLAVSQGHWKETTEQLKRVRSLVCEEREEDAIFEAAMEEWRRSMNDLKSGQSAEVEKQLERAQPWVKRMWEEDKGEKRWGFMMFVHPEVEEDGWREHMDGLLFHAQDAVGCGGAAIGGQWKLQQLQWPADDGQEMPSEELGSHTTGPVQPVEHETEAEDDDDHQTDNGESHMVSIAEDLLPPPEALFVRLRQQFRSLSRRPAKRRKLDDSDETATTSDGILINVFLVVSDQSMESQFNKSAHPDDAWLWAVDPDYEDKAPLDTPADSDTSNEYRGYLRVRVQQLVNNFYDLRRFHEQEYSLKQLWQAAQRSGHKAFVSVKQDEQRMYRSEPGGVGSALRKTGTKRIVYSIDDL
nr:hypothetical protein B0A51_12068 [Rachicladosporium sp. CCFEE 5018]